MKEPYLLHVIYHDMSTQVEDAREHSTRTVIEFHVNVIAIDMMEREA